MKTSNTDVSGLTPNQWRIRLDEVSKDPVKLSAALVEMEREMKQERSWIHDAPTTEPLMKSIISFFLDDDDDDYVRLGRTIREELAREDRLKDLFRSWMPDENYMDRLFLYVKDFAGNILPDDTGLQFPGFKKYKGINKGYNAEGYVFFLNERFPGRDPANFHVQLDGDDHEVILKRIYRMELPRIEGITTPARAVLAEMIADIAPDPSVIRALVVDNAANIKTRQVLLNSTVTDSGADFSENKKADVAETPLGNLMTKLAQEIALVPGDFDMQVMPYGMLKITLKVSVG